MVTGSNIDMLPTMDNGLERPGRNLEDSLTELELMLLARHNQQFVDCERDLNIYRSGSAPPTVEGSLSAVGSLFSIPDFRDINGITGVSSNSSNNGLSEDEIRSHPAYLSYYYSHENINPRLPPPLLSKEDWRVAQRFQASGSSLGSIGDWRKKNFNEGGDSSSLFSMQPSLSAQQGKNDLLEIRNVNARNFPRKMSADWHDKGSDSLVGLSGSGLGARRKSFADILQDGLDRPATLSGHLSRPASRNAFSEMLDESSIADSRPPVFFNGPESMESLPAGLAHPGMVGVQSHGKTTSNSFASAVGSSLSRSTTPEQNLVGRSPGSGLPPVGSKISHTEKKNIIGSNVQNEHSTAVPELAEIAATLSGLSLSKTRNVDKSSHMRFHSQADLDNQLDLTFNMPNGHNQNVQQQFIDRSNAEKLPFSSNYVDLARQKGISPNINASKISSNGQVSLPRRTSSSADLYAKVHSELGSSERSDVGHPNVNLSNTDFISHLPGTYSVNQKLNSVIKNHLNAGSSGDRTSLNRAGIQGSDLSPIIDPRYIQYLQKTSQYGTHAAAILSSLPAGNYAGTLQGDLNGLQKAYLEAILAEQKQQYELSLLAKASGRNHGYYGNPSYGLGMPFTGSPLENSVLPTIGSGSIQNDRNARFNSMMRNSIGGWHADISNNVNGRYISSLLDEFKNKKTRSFELLDIIDHVVEFSTDQYGSRFIQQKLETATEEEKNKIFPEIIPDARALMTDVFGNYVIQKFFEHGTASQRAELAGHLTGHVLALSLQMYGCRVIQKALEVVDVDQQTRMVAELDGSVMKCVRDQNGNHVIQKSIECVPQDRIQFIISAFHGQVVALSTHPYGCRVIQRVLEHCNDVKTQEIIMEEIMQSVCILAQDQYGNYVIQHVLEHGKPQERSAIIRKLAGQIVKMSLQKFASNVVEKCLTFGGPEERQILVNEMLGSTDENEPLQAMMKDQFGNYVVQKVLETCDDQNLELILSRIKVHLNALKRYTYGKHIVSRVEKLIATGERRIGLLSSLAS